MNVYDFDETIYNGDSTRDFIIYSVRKKPSVWSSIPKQCFCGLLYSMGLMDKQKFKEILFSSFNKIDDMDAFVDEFVELHLKNIKEWYKVQKQEDDLIISASPYFLISKFCAKIGLVDVMASNVDMVTGIYSGLNCHGEEKVRRYFEKYSENNVNEFYSDSYSDTPVAKLAKKAYLVKGNEWVEWDFERKVKG